MVQAAIPGIQRDVGNRQHEVAWALENAKGKTVERELYRMTLAGGVYHLWQERNARIFKAQRRTADQVIKQVVRELHVRARRICRLDKCMQSLNFYPLEAA